MAELRVWAPFATRVDIVPAAGGRPTPMKGPDERGWWTGSAEVTDYAYSVDGGSPIPDPRSPWQPAGVNGPSRVVDHDSFPWTDAGWPGWPGLDGAVVYELHV